MFKKLILSNMLCICLLITGCGVNKEECEKKAAEFAQILARENTAYRGSQVQEVYYKFTKDIGGTSNVKYVEKTVNDALDNWLIYRLEDAYNLCLDGRYSYISKVGVIFDSEEILTNRIKENEKIQFYINSIIMHGTNQINEREYLFDDDNLNWSKTLILAYYHAIENNAEYAKIFRNYLTEYSNRYINHVLDLSHNKFLGDPTRIAWLLIDLKDLGLDDIITTNKTLCARIHDRIRKECMNEAKSPDGQLRKNNNLHSTLVGYTTKNTLQLKYMIETFLTKEELKYFYHRCLHEKYDMERKKEIENYAIQLFGEAEVKNMIENKMTYETFISKF